MVRSEPSSSVAPGSVPETSTRASTAVACSSNWLRPPFSSSLGVDWRPHRRKGVPRAVPPPEKPIALAKRVSCALIVSNFTSAEICICGMR